MPRHPINYWSCPYYTIRDAHGVRCEAGRLALPGKREQDEYIRTFCCDHLGWKRCTLARAVSMYYDHKAAAERARQRSEPKPA